MQNIKLGKAGDLEISAEPSAVLYAVLMAVLFSAGAYILLHLSLLSSIIGGATVTLIHYSSELFHQRGHAEAASRAGYPMTGVVFWTIFSRSIYPPDEPELPAETHIARALGGPATSAVMTVIAGVALAIVASTSGTSGLIFSIFAFFFLDNLLFFTLGSFLPLGFTDGSTLLRWLPKRKKG